MNQIRIGICQCKTGVCYNGKLQGLEVTIRGIGCVLEERKIDPDREHADLGRNGCHLFLDHHGPETFLVLVIPAYSSEKGWYPAMLEGIASAPTPSIDDIHGWIEKQASLLTQRLWEPVFQGWLLMMPRFDPVGWGVLS